MFLKMLILKKIINDEGNEDFIVDSVSYLSDEVVIFYKIIQFVLKIHLLIFYRVCLNQLIFI